MSSMPDALSAAGLLLAAIALVYSAWSASIEAEAKRKYSANAGIKADEKRETRRVLNARAWPMTVACWLVFVTFIPRSFDILRMIWGCARVSGTGCSYDDVSAIFLITQVVVVGLAVHLTTQVCQLRKQASG